MRKLNQIWNPPTTKGIFNALSTTDFEWLSGVQDQLDIYYNNIRSGQKRLTSYVESLLDDGKLSSDGLNNIAQMLTVLYKEKWNKLYAAINAEYNPIHNYDMTENGEDKHTGTDTVKDTGTAASNVSSSDSSSSIYGYNSSTPTPSQSEHSDTSTSTDMTSTDTKNLSDTHYLTRSGNIGVTTSQQMLQSEIELRKWNFYHTVMEDIDMLVVLKIY